MNWQKVFRVAVYEFRTNVVRGGYLFATFGIPLLGLLVVMVLHALTSPSTTKVKTVNVSVGRIAVYDRSGILPRGIPLPHPFVAVSDFEKAKEETAKGKFRALVLIPEDYTKQGEVTVYATKGIADLDSVVERLGYLLLYARLSPHYSATEAQRLLQPLRMNLVLITKESEVSSGGRMFTGYALSIIFFTAIFISAGYLLQSVAAEKESHLIEILLSSLTSMELLWGKVIGLAGLGLLQVVVWLTSLWHLGRHVSIGVQGFEMSLKQLMHPDVQIVVAALVIMPLGYITYGLLLAGFGALGDNFRESQQLSAVVSFLAVTPFMFNYFFFMHPDSWVVRAFCYFPLTAPVAVFLRLSVESVPWWDLGISLVALALGAAISLWIGVRLFRVGVLLSGKRPSVKEIWEILKNPA